MARAQALATDLHHIASVGKARGVNPSTQVYELIAILIGVRTDEKCPITGEWKPIGDGTAAIQISKGDTMPTHNSNAVNWRLQPSAVLMTSET